MGEEYLARTVRWQSRRLFTDKLPQNWANVAAIHAKLPGARIIGCERDAAWSCYKQLLAPARVAYSYDLDELSNYLADSRRHWHWFKHRTAQSCHTQVHEALIADTESELRALLEFCGLPFDPTCMRFHEAQRDIRTASAAQVRQPLRRDIARTARYAELFDPIRAALARTDRLRPD
jgi:Sulfotransferase family